MVLVKVSRPERFLRNLNSSQLLFCLLLSSWRLMFLCYLLLSPSKGDLSCSLCCLSWFWFCQLFLICVWQDVFPMRTLVPSCFSVLLCCKVCHLAGSLVYLWFLFVGHISHLCKMLVHFVVMLSQCYKILIYSCLLYHFTVLIFQFKALFY